MIVRFRSQSADDYLAVLLGLKNELNAIGNNFNQAVHKLHKFDKFSEIKAWAILNETSKNIFMKKVADISEKMSEIYERLSK